jgi:hypothetical protein
VRFCLLLASGQINMRKQMAAGRTSPNPSISQLTSQLEQIPSRYPGDRATEMSSHLRTAPGGDPILREVTSASLYWFKKSHHWFQK